MKALYFCDETQVDRVAALCNAAGTGIEVQAFYDPGYHPKHPDAIECHRKAIAPIPQRSLHGPFGDLCPGSFDPMVRDVARFRFDEAVVVARNLNINQIVLHHGYIPNTGPTPRWVERSGRFWKEFLQDNPDSLQIHLENVFESGPELIAEVIDTVANPRIDVCLDTGHVHCFSKGDCVSWVKHLKKRIGYVHLHDNHGLKDEHLGLGEGNIPLVEVCAALEEHAPDAVWALECQVDQMMSSHDWLRTHGFI